MTTIVLGHSGFIGKYIYNNLKKNNKKVIGGNTKNCNLLNKKKINNFFKKKNNFNLIICSSLVKSKVDNQKSFNKNILMISNLLSVINKKKINKIIFLSSIDVYKSTAKFKESTSPTVPKTKYGLSKLISEYLLKNEFSHKKLVILRLTGVYDDDIKGRNMISHIRRGFRARSLNINSSGNELRDYIHVADVAKIVSFFLKNNFSGIYNLATGSSKSVRSYVDKIKKLQTSKKVEIKYSLKNNLQNITIDITKLKKIFSLSKIKNF